MKIFCDFIEKTPQQILEEYESMTDREFRRKYARYLRALIGQLNREEYAIGSVKAIVAAIRSFFKYNDLPLGHVPLARNKVTFHNRDITRDEIVRILEISRPREKAYYCIMAQSGLRPDTVSNLKLKHMAPDFGKGIIPCKIEVPEELAKGQFGAFFTFVGEESIKYLKAYLATRPGIGPEDYLFTAHGRNKPLDRSSISHVFCRAITTLKEKGIMDFDQKAKGKPRTVRLYNLRKFFRKYGGQAGIEYVNFWMGHKTNYKAPHIPASDEHHFSREDVEFQRQLYKEKAMPFLRLEIATPTETEKTIAELRKQLTNRDKEINTMKEAIAQMQPLVEFVNSFSSPRELKKILDFLKDDSMIQFSYDPRTELDKHIADKVNEITKREGITQAEALEQLIKREWEIFAEADEKRKELAKARGLPITREDYEEQKKKKKRLKK